MRRVKTTESVGMVLCHDVTKIVPGEFKGALFKKGHIIKAEDVEALLDIGKEHLFVWESDDLNIHENDAASRIAQAVSGNSTELTCPKEGRVNVLALSDGLLKVNTDILSAVNSVEEVAVATRHNNSYVRKGDTLAGTRVIPLVINKEKVEKVEEICAANEPIISVKPVQSYKTGVITTGSEVYSGRIEDRFGPVVIKKLEDFGSPVLHHTILPDDKTQIAEEIHSLIDQGLELVVITGGMSVDPDDATPGAVKAAGADIITYGTPLFPGAMFLLAYIADVPILGLPGCVMYHKATVFDIILPRILAGEKLARQEITRLGHGGLCLDCPQCHYPHCSFGK
ncbi:molybdopterin-binding protein [Dethiobacter alkaliphilus]|uniref:molybdopterin-binding protein n=1 Tax=Dethiobacter alkaliphilus TaxID=427926 RepID=UPI0022277C77|nr:molybdopterin-binding protein [Dethiobacter alkaliphilus]MCW3490017.1 molybdopterin-binding protein [Dethiobacter alkaliphilus]